MRSSVVLIRIADSTIRRSVATGCCRAMSSVAASSISCWIESISMSDSITASAFSRSPSSRDVEARCIIVATSRLIETSSSVIASSESW